MIEIEGTYGSINLFQAVYASIITRDGEEHLIQNEDLIINPVINWSLSDRNVRVWCRLVFQRVQTQMI